MIGVKLIKNFPFQSHNQRILSNPIQMFDSFKIQQARLNGTPVKRRKLNDVSSFDDDLQFGLSLTRKKSMIDCFHFVGAINRKDSCKLPLLRKQSMARNPFDQSQANEISFLHNSRSKRKTNNFQMQIQRQDSEKMSSSSEEPLPRDIKLIKRVTMINTTSNEAIPRLFRCNSGIDVQQIMIQTEDRKYGDNIYLQQLNSLKRMQTMKSKSNKQNRSRHANEPFRHNYHRKTYQEDSQQEENEQQRLLKDYEVSNNLHAYKKNHENYICLNKLERIFYYVKKINFSDQYTQDDIFELCQLQIKLYNRDDDGHMLRFYQSWEEEDCVYLVFQTASTSLQEKLEMGVKMRENQVWSLLTDCCATLNWMKQSKQYHLNIKPGNLLKCRDKFKLSDPFVSYIMLDKALKMFKGDSFEQEKLRVAFRYAAPQLLEFRSFIQGLQFEQCDIFSLGLCILENITGISVNILKLDLRSIRNQNQKYLKGYSITLRNLIMRMVSSDPTKRPTSEEISSLRKLELFELKLPTRYDEDKLSPQKPRRKLSL